MFLSKEKTQFPVIQSAQRFAFQSFFFFRMEKHEEKTLTKTMIREMFESVITINF
jgi:hypothetical protein